jgi:hypothetical protein
MLREQQVENEIVGVEGGAVMGSGVTNEDTREMLDSSRAKQILREMNQARLGELQEAHDAAKCEAERLKQKQQRGTQQHMVVSEKQRLRILIGKANKERKKSINSMMPFVRYIVQNTENHGIPDDWKKMALDGEPYWCLDEEEDAMTPSISEKQSIVESYLRRQRAWEQITVVLPRETVDAMRFFAKIEVAASTLAHQQPVDGDNIAREYHMGSFAMLQDIIDECRDCRKKCGYLWNTMEAELLSENIIEVTSVSGSVDGIPAHRKVQATLPFINPSNAPGIELLQEHLIPVPDSVQQDTVAEGGGFTSGSSN